MKKQWTKPWRAPFASSPQTPPQPPAAFPVAASFLFYLIVVWAHCTWWRIVYVFSNISRLPLPPGPDSDAKLPIHTTIAEPEAPSRPPPKPNAEKETTHVRAHREVRAQNQRTIRKQGNRGSKPTIAEPFRSASPPTTKTKEGNHSTLIVS